MRKRSAPPIRLFDAVPSDVVQSAKCLSALLAPDGGGRNHLDPDLCPEATASVTWGHPFTCS